MRFQYTEKKVTLPENVHKYAEKKVMKLERFFGTDADALVTFSVEKNRNNVEITVHAANTYFRASESTSDMFASIDAAVATTNARSARIRPVWPGACVRTRLSALRTKPRLHPRNPKRAPSSL